MINRKKPLIFIFLVITLWMFGLGMYQLLNPSIEIQWSTATEIDTLGFNVFRGDTEDGPFLTQINKTLVPPSADMLTGGQYRLDDNKIQAGRTYYYLLQEVQMGGGTEDFGPIEAEVRHFGYLEIGASVLFFLGYWVIRKKTSASFLGSAPHAFIDQSN
ncbi:MAG: hypothetical protein BGO78_12330 [Chloroflexi bacterium 44-23]|nr:MAG: hypothetical protein BGO78_12330 [Chloroflexi bacterium 44-23]